MKLKEFYGKTIEEHLCIRGRRAFQEVLEEIQWHLDGCRVSYISQKASTWLYQKPVSMRKAAMRPLSSQFVTLVAVLSLTEGLAVSFDRIPTEDINPKETCAEQEQGTECWM